jgi:hypothetical protein
MTEFELLELLRTANESVDTNFQFWLSSSFAVLLAFFFAGERIVSYIKWAVVLLYVASTVLFTYRIQASGRVATRAREALEQLSSDFLIISSEMSAIMIGGSFMTIILVGTIATVYFCINSKTVMKKEIEGDT